MISEKYQLQDEIAYLKDRIQISKNMNFKLKKDRISQSIKNTTSLVNNSKRLIAEKSNALRRFPNKFRIVNLVRLELLSEDLILIDT
jgi:peptide subunit release factor 1 (eRF1)